MASRGKSHPSRREILKAALASGAVLAAGLALPEGSLAAIDGKQKETITVFRLRTRNTHSCKACKIHHRYTIAISHAHADRNRAHVGCNCPIVKQRLSLRRFKELFIDTRAIQTGVIDLRHVKPTGRGEYRGYQENREHHEGEGSRRG
jgi:hypothetical protein